MIIVTFPLPSSITPLDRRHSLVLFSSVLRLRCYFPEAKRLVHVGGVGDWGKSALGEAGGKVGAETQCLAVCSAPTPLGCGQEYQATLFQWVCVPATSSGWAGVLNRQRAHLVLLEACQYPDTLSWAPLLGLSFLMHTMWQLDNLKNTFPTHIPFTSLRRGPCLPRVTFGSVAWQRLSVAETLILAVLRSISAAVQHERGPRTSTIRKQVALYFRGHKEENGTAAHFPSAALPAPAFFTAVTQLEPHGLELATVSTTPERQTLVSLAQPTPKVSGLLGPRRPVPSKGRRGVHPTPS